jgi:2-oxoglutarate dehydrogenase E2 component (dihydrolipoamide succinyltransferase)
MATEVNLPALGESVTEGTVTQWLKQVGDDVAVDEALLEVSTDKVDTEIPSPVAGTLLEIRADTDETVEVGAVLAVIGDSSESSDGAPAGSGADDDAAADGGSDGADEGGPADETDSAEAGGAEARAAESEGAASDGAESDGSESDGSESDGSESGGDAGSGEDAPAESRPASDGSPAEQPDGGGGPSTDVKLPELGESVTEGTVTQWLKQVGDEVAVDEPLLEVSTDKVDTEIPSPVAGTLLEIRVDTDETVGVGAVLAVIGSGSPADKGGGSGAEQQAPDSTSDEEASEPTAAPAEGKPSEAQPSEAQPSEAEPSEAEASGAEDKESTEQQPEAEPKPAKQPSPDRAPAADEEPAADDGKAEASQAQTRPAAAPAYVTPLVRKLAAQHDVDLATVTGSGVGGRIRKQDVLAAAEAGKQAEPAPAAQPAAAAPAATPSEPSPLRGKTEKLSRLRQVIARRMVESLQTSAQLTTVVEVDVTSIARMRARHKASFEQREGVKLSFLPFFAKAAVDALKIHPQLNASIDTEKNEVTYAPSENLGVAVDTERGLLVATVRDAGDLSIPGLARKIADLAERTRTNKITPDELSGATFTLTNTGSRGALFDTPIIFQPQVAILGTGAVVKRAVVIDDPNLGETIAVRQMVYLALTYDHRLVDGADAARFLSAVKQRLEEANFEGDLV